MRGRKKITQKWDMISKHDEFFFQILYGELVFWFTFFCWEVMFYFYVHLFFVPFSFLPIHVWTSERKNGIFICFLFSKWNKILFFETEKKNYFCFSFIHIKSSQSHKEKKKSTLKKICFESIKKKKQKSISHFSSHWFIFQCTMMTLVWSAPNPINVPQHCFDGIFMCKFR